MSSQIAPLRLLSIEDDPQVRASIVAWMEDSGFFVIEAKDGLEGLRLFRAELPDLVLLDMGLPGMPGREVLEAIALDSPDTPVIIVSANADISDAIGAFKAGAWDYVTKPIMNFDVLEQTIRNCLERKALREQVKQAEERYRDLLQSLPVVVFSLDQDQRLDFINNTCLDVTGYSVEEALAEPDWLFCHTHRDDRGPLREIMAAAASEPGKAFRVNFRFEHRLGYTLHLRAHSLEPGQNQPSAVGGIITDVTESVFLEKVLVQREKLNTLGAVTSELAHEIRNPLMSLGGFARRLAKAHPDLDEAAIILEQAERLEKLLNRITAYTSPVPVTLQKINVSALLTFCLDRLTPSLVRRALDVLPRLDLDLPEVLADPDLLTETLANLVAHLTRDMTAQGKLLITTSETAGYVRVDFELNDPGFQSLAEDTDHLLMPFEEGGGTLNLALAHRNMRDLGGHLALTHTEGGLSVTVSLPLAEADDPSEEVGPEPPLNA